MIIRAVNIQDEACVRRYQELKQYISKERQEKLEGFHYKEDSWRSLYGEILLRDYLMQNYGLQNNDIQIGRNQYGKPYILGMEQVSFNISHSGDWVVCAIDEQSGTIGVDIEKIAAIDLKIARRFFAPCEYERLMQQEEKTREIYFFRLWTLKECYIKFAGKGLSIPLDSFWFEMEREQILISGEHLSPVFFHQQIMDERYVVAVCSERQYKQWSIDYIKYNDLMN